MHWDITEMLASPTTGTAFAIAVSPKGFKVILWYKGSYFLRPDNNIFTSSIGLLVNNQPRDIDVIHLFPYRAAFWQTTKAGAQCPGNELPHLEQCSRSSACQFELCPYGIEK